MSDSDKPYKLTFDEREGYLYALVQAETISNKIAVDYITEVVAKCRATNNSRVILERDIPVMLRTASLFFTTDTFTKMSRGIRIAFVNPHAELSDAFNFAITTAINRQAAFTVHKSVADAEKYFFRGGG